MKVQQGPAKAEMVEQGWRAFLHQGSQSGRSDGGARGGQPERGPVPNRPANAARVRWMDMQMANKQPMKAHLSGLGSGVSNPADLRERGREARSETRVRCGPGLAGSRVPQRGGHPVHHRSVRESDVPRPGLKRQAHHRLVSDPGRKAAGLPFADQAPRAGLLFSSAGLSRRWRVCRASARQVHDRVFARAGVSQSQSDADNHGHCSADADVPAGAVDRSGQDRLVFRRSSHPCGRVRALRAAN